MKYSDNVLNLLAARSFRSIGNAWIAKNWDVSLSIEELVCKIKEKSSDNVTEKIFRDEKEKIIARFERIEEYYDGAIGLGDSKFPPVRGNVKAADLPNVLFYKGDLNLLSLQHKNVAVIGVLNPDDVIEQDERHIVDLLVKQEAVIVSGLALGCDRIAHHQALVSKGTTVAILPSTIQNIIPKECVPLADYIGSNGGLLITEYYEEPKTLYELNGRYIHRDRLQALFSDVVLLSASYDKDSIDPDSTKIDSGSRYALEKAKEYGIARAVIYNKTKLNNPKYDLNRYLIESDSDVVVINPDNPDEGIKAVVSKVKGNHVVLNAKQGSDCVQEDLF